ncbi:hypothetical protein C2845_PM07G07970 [Panicum miliaceum]|uniref:Uncharacterized protein n=1 Tax=Panicum miliaceum TaxID=4540 RepID=A0A3L6SPI6_PANMI|nr:hypothetical protein C2845_PM07G07970 [Panicum miliaceum]
MTGDKRIGEGPSNQLPIAHPRRRSDDEAISPFCPAPVSTLFVMLRFQSILLPALETRISSVNLSVKRMKPVTAILRRLVKSIVSKRLC